MTPGQREAPALRSLATERWLPVPGYEGLYEVSDQGRVRSVRRRQRTPGGLLKPHLDKRGYALVTPWRGDERKTFPVHRLVLLAFVGEPAPGHECRHLDGDPSNNRLTNLAWGTATENQLDRVRHGTHNHAGKTHCKHGHEFTPENTRLVPKGRECKACNRERKRRSAKSLTVAALPPVDSPEEP